MKENNTLNAFFSLTCQLKTFENTTVEIELFIANYSIIVVESK